MCVCVCVRVRVRVCVCEEALSLNDLHPQPYFSPNISISFCQDC